VVLPRSMVSRCDGRQAPRPGVTRQPGTGGLTWRGSTVQAGGPGQEGVTRVPDGGPEPPGVLGAATRTRLATQGAWAPAFLANGLGPRRPSSTTKRFSRRITEARPAATHRTPSPAAHAAWRRPTAGAAASPKDNARSRSTSGEADHERDQRPRQRTRISRRRPTGNLRYRRGLGTFAGGRRFECALRAQSAGATGQRRGTGRGPTRTRWISNGLPWAASCQRAGRSSTTPSIISGRLMADSERRELLGGRSTGDPDRTGPA